MGPVMDMLRSYFGDVNAWDASMGRTDAMDRRQGNNAVDICLKGDVI